MEITKRVKTTQNVLGGKPFLSGDKVVKNWLHEKIKTLLNPNIKKLQDAVESDSKLEEILSVFNTNGNGEPIVGNWMLFSCSKKAAKLANTWGKYKVSAERWADSVLFSPEKVIFHNNGNIITQPDGVDCYAVSLKDGRSFFKAYQYINAGAEFEFTIEYPEDLCEKIEGKGKDKAIVPDPKQSTECVNAVLDKMCKIGIGAFRERFGKFEIV